MVKPITVFVPSLIVIPLIIPSAATLEGPSARMSMVTLSGQRRLATLIISGFSGTAISIWASRSAESGDAYPFAFILPILPSRESPSTMTPPPASVDIVKGPVEASVWPDKAIKNVSARTENPSPCGTLKARRMFVSLPSASSLTAAPADSPILTESEYEALTLSKTTAFA